MNLKSFLQAFKPQTLLTSIPEKLRSALAGGGAILLLTLIIHHLPQEAHHLFIITSMAASATLLYVTPHSPLAQPWNLIGGHMVSAFSGLLCGAFIADQTLAAGAAVGLAILLMQQLKCLHPPGGATALVMVIGGTQLHGIDWQWSVYIVAINAGFSLLLALALNNLLPGRRYPMAATATSTQSLPIDRADLDWALEQIDSVIDVSEEDLEEIYRLAAQHAGTRHKVH